jgi:hypothetical protein
MKRSRLTFIFFASTLLVLCSACQTEQISLWERMCGSCHDGSTVLNGKVVIGKEEMKAKYKTQDELAKAVACEGPPCMNILKHDEDLVRRVGAELGMSGASKN